ncbi:MULTISPECIES: OmpA family protein [unclassified Pseudoalteromonas]|uniref:OmpA family protein n=1 Tax=unclassified Pseudoalteromonas TaxID=194690 RepID=UPI0025B3E09C|nr:MULTISPECIES: OmpA family protein [unclassified Pseudoalteromonas]MDN3380387.1 OmpA family protein [Pseudoalteromonas sp. APC 3893]MDN3388772.1 OmpA family protein [Pseudoalteromonas sp. APC 4017]
MKLKSLTIAIALAATSASSFAAEKEGFFIGAFGDYYDASWENIRGTNGMNVDDSTGWGAELGYRFNDYWSARLEYADMDFDISSSDPAMTATSMDGDRLGIDGLYHINGGPFYGLFGLKQLDVSENLTFANVGAGYQHYFTDNFAFNAEAALYQGLDRGYTDVAGKLGLSYIFGKQGSSAPVEAAPTAAVVPVAVAPTDSDNDNIPDADDQCANTPMTDAVDGTGCTLYEDREVTKSLLITFPNNTSKVSEKYLDDIDKAVAFLNEHPGTEVLLEGHTSSVGKADYNKWLSKKRADAVAARLIEDGIDKERIITVGLGEERLKNEANTASAHAENRRVEAHVTVIERVKVKR